MNQPLPLVDQLKNLEHLQEIDLKIDSLKREQSSLPSSLKSVDDSLAKLRHIMEAKKSQIQELEKAHRQTQAAHDLNQDRLTRSNGKLESVQNSQEFQAASKEIDQLKKLNATLEEQSKKSDLDLASLRKEMDTVEEQFKNLQGDRDSKATLVTGQANKFKADISTLTAERGKFSSNVEPKILTQYDRVRGARNGIGIVPAVGGRCKGCNMMVPPQLYNEVQRGSMLHACPSCHRILFVPVTAPKADSQG